jgi:hypothetical protein
MQLSVFELDERFAVLRDNIRQLIERAAILSEDADDDRTSDLIVRQSAEPQRLLGSAKPSAGTEGTTAS